MCPTGETICVTTAIAVPAGAGSGGGRSGSRGTSGAVAFLTVCVGDGSCRATEPTTPTAELTADGGALVSACWTVGVSVLVSFGTVGTAGTAGTVGGRATGVVSFGTAGGRATGVVMCGMERGVVSCGVEGGAMTCGV